MIRSSKLYSLLLVVCVVFLALAPQVSSEPVSASAITRIQVSEGNDYATQVLRDPWDMSNFSDISQNLNDQGRHSLLTNIKVENGIFSASSGSFQDGSWTHFYALAPGSHYEMLAGKIGYRQPINPNIYKCVYMRMRGTTTSSYEPLWFPAWENVVPAERGNNPHFSKWPKVNPSGLPKGSWNLQQMNLGSSEMRFDNLSWTSRSGWQGFMIHPISTGPSEFSIDWIRLTDCSPVNVSVSWSPRSGQTRLWAGINQIAKDFTVQTLSAGTGSATVDVQGWAPGIYKLSIEVNGTLESINQEIEVVADPIVEFTNPSPVSGPDYATSQGNAWDMDSPADVPDIRCAEYSFANGILSLVTQHPATLPEGCAGMSQYHEADPKTWLSLPVPFNPAEYRYLTFRMKIEGDVQRVADGMIGRLIWHDQASGCDQVSKGIPFDVGWHTYVIDLHDPENGVPAEGCNAATSHWKTSGMITELRFDPNENYTGKEPGVAPMVFRQEFDWFRLTKVAEVKKGERFPVGIEMNKTMSDVTLTYYYTTSRSTPKQHPATVEAEVTEPPSPPAGPRRLYIPMITRGSTGSTVAPTGYWVTTSVNPGEYYLCVEAKDNSLPTSAAVYCSDAPVKVLP